MADALSCIVQETSCHGRYRHRQPTPRNRLAMQMLQAKFLTQSLQHAGLVRRKWPSQLKQSGRVLKQLQESSAETSCMAT